MAGNRKLTDFFEATTTAPKEFAKGDGVEDTIVVVQDNRNNTRYPNERARGPSKCGSSHRGTTKPSSGTATAGYNPTIKKGKPMVRSSDSEDTDSDSSFGDLDDLLYPQNVSEISARGIRNTPTCLPDRSSPVKRTRSQSNRQRWETETPPTAPSYKFSMASLVMQTEKDTASEAGAARARAALGLDHRHKSFIGYGDELSVGDSEMIEATDVGDGIHKGLLASVISEKGEEGDFQKVLGAMKRTEALNRDKVWYFFENSSSAPPSSRAAFPLLNNVPFKCEALLDSVTRQHSFLAGFFGVMPMLGRNIPDEVIAWILDDLCFETRDDLKYAYRRQLTMITNPVGWPYSPTGIYRLFRNLGGSNEATRLRGIANPIAGTPLGRDLIPANLASVIQLLGESAGNIPDDAKEYAICILARLTIDKCIAETGELQVRIEDAIASLVSSIAEEQKEELLLKIGTTIFRFVTHAPLRLQLLDCFPSHTPCLHLFRRRLALAFFFNDSLYLTRREGDLLEIQRITRELDKSEFHIDNSTDYTRIASLISILDICIDNGASPSSFKHKDQENAFNTDIDNLANKLKSMFTKIVDTGASYMARTEAKEVLERVHFRLVFAVRTKERLKNSIFRSNSGNSMDNGPKAQSTLTKFLSKGP